MLTGMRSIYANLTMVHEATTRWHQGQDFSTPVNTDVSCLRQFYSNLRVYLGLRLLILPDARDTNAIPGVDHKSSTFPCPRSSNAVHAPGGCWVEAIQLYAV